MTVQTLPDFSMRTLMSPPCSNPRRDLDPHGEFVEPRGHRRSLSATLRQAQGGVELLGYRVPATGLSVPIARWHPCKRVASLASRQWLAREEKWATSRST